MQMKACEYLHVYMYTHTTKLLVKLYIPVVVLEAPVLCVVVNCITAACTKSERKEMACHSMYTMSCTYTGQFKSSLGTYEWPKSSWYMTMYNS